MAPVDPFAPIVLRHADLHLEMHILPLGANPVRFIYTDPATGEQNDMLIGPEDPRDHWRGRAFLGPVIGRYANRLPAGHIKYKGGECEVPEFSAPGVSLHGGPQVTTELPVVEEGILLPQAGPIDRIVFSPLSSSQSRLFSADSSAQSSDASVIVGAISNGVAAGQPGYPGTLRIELRFALQPGTSRASSDGNMRASLGTSAGVFHMEYRAALVDDDSSKVQATPLNMTHHWAFNLSASNAKAREAEQGTIFQHTLRIRATPGIDVPRGAQCRPDGQHLWTPELDDSMVPTGKLVACTPNGPHDFLHPGPAGLGRTLKNDASPADMYDNQYIWGVRSAQTHVGSAAAANGDEPRLVLSAPSTGLSIAFSTDQAAVQIYSTTGLPQPPAAAEASTGGAKKRLHGGDGTTIGNHYCSGLCLEFGAPHATLLHEQYQQLAQGDTILHKDDEYRHFVEAEVFVKGRQ